MYKAEDRARRLLRVAQERTRHVMSVLPSVGARVMLANDVERFDCRALVPSGRLGTVRRADLDTQHYSVRLDRLVDGLEAYDNELDWSEEQLEEALAEVMPL